MLHPSELPTVVVLISLKLTSGLQGIPMGHVRATMHAFSGHPLSQIHSIQAGERD